tara:strand:- start:1386 stop:1631 length:246 start_codon:yes stop_codon:yes gene_type:complete
MLKKIMICFAFFFASATSCTEKEKEVNITTECEQIKDIVTDCMGLHRGALNYIKSCGDISLSELDVLDSCEEKLNYIENKD